MTKLEKLGAVREAAYYAARDAARLEELKAAYWAACDAYMAELEKTQEEETND
jgi:hypothetical protein